MRRDGAGAKKGGVCVVCTIDCNIQGITQPVMGDPTLNGRVIRVSSSIHGTWVGIRLHRKRRLARPPLSRARVPRMGLRVRSGIRRIVPAIFHMSQRMG